MKINYLKIYIIITVMFTLISCANVNDKRSNNETYVQQVAKLGWPIANFTYEGQDSNILIERWRYSKELENKFIAKRSAIEKKYHRCDLKQKSLDNITYYVCNDRKLKLTLIYIFKEMNGLNRDGFMKVFSTVKPLTKIEENKFVRELEQL